jgi:hypothetical protein
VGFMCTKRHAVLQLASCAHARRCRAVRRGA